MVERLAVNERVVGSSPTRGAKKYKSPEEFVKYLIDSHDVYWLTIHCTGDSEYTIKLLKKFFSGENLELLERIKPTYWREFKTEAIDFKEDFLWLDDHLLEEEIQVLKRNKKFDSWVEVDLSKNPDQLKD